MNATELVRQWRELNGRHPSTWPRTWRNTLLLMLFLAVLLVGSQFYLMPEIDALERSGHDYAALKAAYPQKHRQAMTFANSARRTQHLEQVVATLEQQLQAHADMDAVLNVIGDAALENRLQFESARPAPPGMKHGYVEASIAIRLSGNYHDVGRFAAAVAAMTQIVVLGDMRMNSTGQPGQVTLEAVALTYRRGPDKEGKS